MKDYEDEIEGLDSQTDGLRQTLDATSGMVTSFDSELRRMRESLAATGKDVATLEKGLSKGLRKAFDGLVFDGASLASALDAVETCKKQKGAKLMADLKEICSVMMPSMEK